VNYRAVCAESLLDLAGVNPQKAIQGTKTNEACDKRDDSHDEQDGFDCCPHGQQQTSRQQTEAENDSDAFVCATDVTIHVLHLL
jgi:hypothetical protein